MTEKELINLIEQFDPYIVLEEDFNDSSWNANDVQTLERLGYCLTVVGFQNESYDPEAMSESRDIILQVENLELKTPPQYFSIPYWRASYEGSAFELHDMREVFPRQQIITVYE